MIMIIMIIKISIGALDTFGEKKTGLRSCQPPWLPGLVLLVVLAVHSALACHSVDP